MTLVIDASVACKWYLIEARSDRAWQIATSDEELVAPELLLAEVANVLWRRSLGNEIDPSNAVRAIALLKGMFRILLPTADLVDSAWEAALTLRHPVYDCLYLTAARQMEAQLVTDDLRLQKVVKGTEWEPLVRPLASMAP